MKLKCLKVTGIILKMMEKGWKAKLLEEWREKQESCWVENVFQCCLRVFFSMKFHFFNPIPWLFNEWKQFSFQLINLSPKIFHPLLDNENSNHRLWFEIILFLIDFGCTQIVIFCLLINLCFTSTKSYCIHFQINCLNERQINN